jgi:sorbitol-specific phosphotransferase system component IIC
MNVQQHVGDSGPGIVGTTVAGGFTFVGFVTSAIPVLQVISLIAGIAVAIVTFIYYYGKVRSHELEAVAKVAAESAKASVVETVVAIEKGERPRPN